METKDARRRRKLHDLITLVDGGLDGVAVQAQLNPQYLRQIINGTLLPAKKDGTRSPRALGDGAAEAIEDAYDLGRGWFDSDKPVPAKAPRVEQSHAAYHIKPANMAWPWEDVTPEQFLSLTPEQHKAIEVIALQFLKARDPPVKHARPGTNSAAA